MGVTYPSAASPSFNGDYLTIHRFLKEPGMVARRVQELAMNKYVADFLLTMPLRAEGGALIVESGAPLGTNANPRAVSPLGDYPLVTIGGGIPSVVMTTNWGQDTKVSDAAIRRQRMNPVNTGLKALVEQNVTYIDSIAMSGISTAVKATRPATAPIATATAEQILLDVFKASAALQNLKRGFAPNVAVMQPIPFAVFAAKLLAARMLTDADAQAVMAGTAFPNIQGTTFVSSPSAPAGEIIVADNTRLGGMADEPADDPGYATATLPGAPRGIQVKSIRLEENDGYRLRARRITVPVIVEEDAAVRITGIGAGE